MALKPRKQPRKKKAVMMQMNHHVLCPSHLHHPQHLITRLTKFNPNLLSGLTAPTAISKQFAETHKGESLSDPIASRSTQSQMEGKSTPDPQQTPTHESSSVVCTTQK